MRKHIVDNTRCIICGLSKWHHYRWPLLTLKATFAVWNLSMSHRNNRVLSTICLHMNRKTHVACSFNYLLESGHLNVRASHVHCRWCGTSSKRCQMELLLLQTINRKWYKNYQIKAIPITLSHLQGHSYCKPFECDFSYNCAAVDKISNHIATLWRCQNHKRFAAKNWKAGENPTCSPLGMRKRDCAFLTYL